jgi:hypothetical protein
MEYRATAEETVQMVVDAVPQDELTSEVVTISRVNYGDTFRAGRRSSDPAYWNVRLYLALSDRPGVAQDMGERIIAVLEAEGWEARLDERLSDEEFTKYAFSRPDLDGRWHAEFYYSEATDERDASVSFLVITPYTTLGDYDPADELATEP